MDIGLTRFLPENNRKVAEKLKYARIVAITDEDEDADGGFDRCHQPSEKKTRRKR